ncbi:MAG: 4-hydroxythreonine-4-phosphate dehydrogenase PdxA, partial [Thermoanaerobaculia bacterium]
MSQRGRLPVLAITQGDPAGVGPEVLLKWASARQGGYVPLVVAEQAALEQARRTVVGAGEVVCDYLSEVESRDQLVEREDRDGLAVLDPVAESRAVEFGESGTQDAGGALACLETAVELARAGVVDAVVTSPVSKYSIARHHRPDFRGQTEFVADLCGKSAYGRDYLMTFLTTDLQVALLTTHIPLTEAAACLSRASVVEALTCLAENAGGRIVVAGLNPHAGEGGLMGREEIEILTPAIEACRERGIDAQGPESADSLFARARRGECDWVLALYHDQGLIPVKTVAFGTATNWTLGLPVIRTSVDHGTAFDIAGTGRADARPLRRVVETTRELIAGRLPR